MATTGNVDEYLKGKCWLTSDSSDIAQIAYDPTTSTVYLQSVQSRRWFFYRDVSVGEAKAFAEAGSQGQWSWTYLRRVKDPSQRGYGMPPGAATENP